MVFLADALTLDAPRRTQDGYMAVRAKAARTGHYQYGGREVDPDNKHGLRDQAVVNVLRDEATVFDQRAVHSFIGKPITNDHPSESVNAANWRDHARGTIMGAKWEEGGYLAFDLLLTDASAIKAVQDGKRELSNGYGAELEFGDFTAADGTKCQARQTSITGNHVALVDRGRAGPECRIVDAAVCESLPSNLLDNLKTEKPVKTMLIDGLTVDVSNADTAIATINTILAARDAANVLVTTHEATITARDATIVAKDAEITKLTADLAAAKVTPAQMRDAAKAYSLTVGKAKAMGVTVTDAMDEAAIKRAVVDKSMGDKAKGYSDDHVSIAFDALTKDAKVEDAGADALRTAISGQPVNVTDVATLADQAWDKANNDLNAWRTAQ
jgi:hypothetical protein